MHRSGSEVDKVIKPRTLNGRKNCELISKFKKAMSCFQIEVFLPVVFPCVSSVLYVFLSVSSVFLLLFFISTFDYHWNNKAVEDTY